MAEKAKRWPKLVGYPLFFVFALVLSFFLTFPFDTLAERVKLEADHRGWYVRLGSLGPGFFAVRATDVELSKKTTGDEVAEPLRIDSVSVGPSLFPPGLSVSSKAFGGRVTVGLNATGTRLKVRADGLDVSKGNLKGYSGVDMEGTISGALDLTIPAASVGGRSEPDLGQANGNLTLNTKGLTVKGGTVTATIPMFGPEPTPLDLPKIILGDVDGKVKFEKGQGTVEELKNKSPHVEFNITGGLKLAKRFEYSEPSLEVRFKPDPEFQKGLGLIGSALSMVPADPADPSWRFGRLTGYLGRPRFP